MVDTFYHYLSCFLLQICIFIFKINTKVRWWITWILEVMDIRRILKSYEVSDDIYIYIRPV